MRRTPGLVVVVAAALVAAAVPALGANAAPATVSSYVVVLEPGSAGPAAEASRLASRYGGQVGFVYRHALRGFSIRTTERGAAALASNPSVDFVEPDLTMSVDEQDTPTGISRIFAPGNTNLDIDGIDDSRVDVDVAVIDTGIDLDHPDLDVAGGVNCLTGSCVTGGDDDHYHGTHVAGTVAALDNDLGVVGVAPGARLWAVKVLNKRGSGSNSVVIAGIDWVAGKGGIEVANLSLGGSKSSAVNAAVAGAVGSGVSVVVAAGNSAADAANYSPASEPTAITVSALADFNGLPGGGAAPTCRSDVDDTFANFSNYGDPIDIIAPGVCIRSTYPDGSYGTISGTSMASPHVAGAVALLRSTGTGRAAAESALIGAGGDDWTLGAGVVNDGEHEPLLDVGTFAPRLIDSPTDGGDGGDGGDGSDPGSPTFTSTAATTNGGWFATIHVANANQDATVAGTWSDGATPNSCVAGADGTCDITRKVNKRTSSVSWTYAGGGDPVPVLRP